MKLLIVTQAVDLDNPILGFFHRWLEEFSTQCDSVEVICLYEGTHSLPENVRVHSLGKERGIVSRFVYSTRFLKLIFGLNNRYDSVFVHMNPEYVVLGGLWWRVMGKRIGLWYVHKSVTALLRIAVLLVNVVYTSSQKSFGIKSNKVHVVGHGIDIARFAANPLPVIDPKNPRLISVGRITPIKRLEILIDALALLREQGVLATLSLVGSPAVATDHEYRESLMNRISEKDLENYVQFVGNVSNQEMPEIYARHDISVNLAPTGGIDKAVLESMAAGEIVFVANEAFAEYLEDAAPDLIFTPESDSLVSHIKGILSQDNLGSLQERMRKRAQQHADVSSLIPAIIKQLV